MEASVVQRHLVSQYLASLAMLKNAIEACPDSLWLATDCHNRFWHIAYHTLFCVHFYLQPSEAEFRPWTRHQADSQFLGPPPGAPVEERILPAPYSKPDVLEYHGFCCVEVETQVPQTSLEASSGFHWLPFNRLELHLYNIRHVQHHTGQLADRLRNAAGIGIDWVAEG